MNRTPAPPASTLRHPTRTLPRIGAQLACALLLAALATIGVLADVRPAAADTACIVDAAAVDDVPAQKDLNEFCVSPGNDGGLAGCLSGDANLTWTWDDTGLTGSNTGDACALYDSDGDGKANFALCTSIASDPAAQSAGSPRFYACDDSKTLNCGGASTVAAAASSCAVSNVVDVFSGTHQGGNACNGNNCTTRDTMAQCCVKHADFPIGGTPELIDVCSYPSSTPSSSPSDCIKTVLCTTDADCSELTDACNTGSCSSDGLTKRCVATPKANGTSCNDGNVCTTGDSCNAGTCTGATTSCDDGNACTDDICDPATGCGHVNNTATCNDGNACTTGDTCSNGICGGATASCDDGNVCTTDSCDPQTGCTHTNTSGACDDGSACTSGDTCTNGVCTGSTISCDDGNPCTDDTCDAGSGCGHSDNTAACNDGNACTTGDTCGNGVCGGAAKSCDDGNPCTDDSCDATLGCVHVANTASCDDGNGCTTGDVCNAGSCGGAPVECNALDGCHEAGTCDPATGQCSNPVKPSGTACSDGDACTGSGGGATGDQCDGNGQCVPGTAAVCVPSDLCHDAGVCDPATGQCSNPAKADGASCNDSNDCTAHDVCTAGTCGGSAVADGTTCNDDNTCTSDDSCQSGSCVGGTVADDGTPCDDEDTCTQTDSCQAGTCVGSNPLADGTPCDDGSSCTSGDQCQAGACTGAAEPNGTSCADGNTCTDTDACYAGACLGLAEGDGTPCEDGNGCTQDDVCGNGTCRGGDPVVCEALDDCHEAGVCDPASGSCSNPVKPAGTSCSDGDGCTGAGGGANGDQCDASGQCVPGTAVECTASDACHEAGVCDPATGQCSVGTAKPSGTSCSDGNACTGVGANGDQCDGSGQCVPGAAVECTASDACHEAGVCDPASGQCSAGAAKPSGTSCSDGNACTGSGGGANGDQCDGSGQCVPGAAVECPAADACHEAGVCDPTSGTCSVGGVKPSGTSCSDGNACTGVGGGDDGDRCDGNGRCVPGTPLDCTPDDPCHESGTCDVTTGTCVVTPKAVDCDDAVCSDDPACAGPVEICDNCIDDNGDGIVDRDDPQCVPFADGFGAGIGDDSKKHGAAVAKCQAAIQAAGVRLATVTRARLQQCADGVFKCIQQKPDDAACLAKARARCVKQTAALADGPQSLAAKLRIKIAKSCGPKKGVPRVSREDLCDATGLGFLGELDACDDPTGPVAAVLTEVGDHLVHEGRCRIAQLFTASTPRGFELLTLGDLHISEDECLDGGRDITALGLGNPVGKAAAKCEKSIGASSKTFFNKVTSSYRRCAAAVFRCVQQKPNDSRCRAKAERRCQKLTATLFDGPRSAEGRMRSSIGRACGARKGKPALLGPDQLSELSGLNYGSLESRCNALGVSSVQSLDGINECMVRQYVCRAEQVLTSQAPRTHELLHLGNARRR